MKVFIIENVKKEVFVVENKTKFCDSFDLTPRLLDYTIKREKGRYQPYHKGYKILEVTNFIESEDGDKTIWGSDIKGYLIKEECISKEEDFIEHDDVNVNHYSYEEKNEIESLQKELKKQLKQKQKVQDQLNLHKKLLRNENRSENMWESIKDEFHELINSNVPISKKSNTSFGEEETVLVLSDLHIGQIIEESNNFFNYNIACERMNCVFNNFIQESKIRNVKNVSVLFLGDLIHSASIVKPDMFASKEFPEVISSLKCFSLLASQIDMLVNEFDNVTIASTVGNESRFNNHYHPSNLQSEAKNNLDLVIYAMIKDRYRNNKNVLFLNDGDELESVVRINGKNILMTHGNSNAINHKDLEKSFINIRARLEPIYGRLDAMVLGHIHSTNISAKVFRNASLAGSNSYSNYLGFAESPISQNMLIINKDRIIGFPLYASENCDE